MEEIQLFGEVLGNFFGDFLATFLTIFLTNFSLSFQWGHVLVNVNHLLTVINSAFNFLIYWSFCCGKRRRRRSRRQREMLGLKTESLKVSKFQKQIFLFSFEPKIKRNYFLISGLASKNGPNQRNEGSLTS